MYHGRNATAQDDLPGQRPGGPFTSASGFTPLAALHQHLLQPGLQQAVKARIRIAGKLLAAAIFAHPPVFENENVVRAVHCAKSVSDDDGSALL
jgi:hypothetical protein